MGYKVNKHDLEDHTAHVHRYSDVCVLSTINNYCKEDDLRRLRTTKRSAMTFRTEDKMSECSSRNKCI